MPLVSMTAAGLAMVTLASITIGSLLERAGQHAQVARREWLGYLVVGLGVGCV